MSGSCGNVNYTTYFIHCYVVQTLPPLCFCCVSSKIAHLTRSYITCTVQVISISRQIVVIVLVQDIHVNLEDIAIIIRDYQLIDSGKVDL